MGTWPSGSGSRSRLLRFPGERSRGPCRTQSTFQTLLSAPLGPPPRAELWAAEACGEAAKTAGTGAGAWRPCPAPEPQAGGEAVMRSCRQRHFAGVGLGSHREG